MKQRVVTGVLGLLLFFGIMFFYDSFVFNVILCAVALIAVHELLLAIGATKNIPLTATALVTGVIPFLFFGINYNIDDNLKKNIIITASLAIFCIFLVIYFVSRKKLSFIKFVSTVFFSIAVPLMFSTLILLRVKYDNYIGLYYTFLIFACAWGSDTGAYFAGKFLGKHKLAPKISPNKTVEGVIGGVFSCMIFVTLVTGGFYLVLKNMFNFTMHINFITLAIVSICASIVGVFGDLSASAIKRQCKIKDFGSILPGHGGVMDRFDSMLLIAPFFFIILQFITIAK
ncbi:MAG: phosphatidate cytidylyltransferase [Oscillospiraceae bacterium]